MSIAGVSKVHGMGTYGDRVKIHFEDNKLMWAFLKNMKGNHFVSPTLAAPDRVNNSLWHCIDKLPWEIGLSKQQCKAQTLMAEALATAG
eukprot:3359540-Pyramimonas_sp.AAC.1